MLPSVRLAGVSFDVVTGVIVGAACLDGCMFAPESEISSVYLLGKLGGLKILFIKLILGVLILILLFIAPNRHLHPFSLPPSLFL